MRSIAVPIIMLVAGGCVTEDNLGNTLSGLPDGAAPDAGPPGPPPAIDAAYVPDANPPHNIGWWGPRLGVTPDQACNPWELDDTAAAAPDLGLEELTLSTTGAERMLYRQAGEDLMVSFIPDHMTIEAVVRLIDGEARVQFRYHGWTDGLTISDGNVVTDGGTTFAMTTTDALHVYRLEVDLWTGQTVVKADEIIISNEIAPTAGSGGPESIEFGQLASGTSAWHHVLHDVHATNTCPLPS